MGTSPMQRFDDGFSGDEPEEGEAEGGAEVSGSPVGEGGGGEEEVGSGCISFPRLL